MTTLKINLIVKKKRKCNPKIVKLIKQHYDMYKDLTIKHNFIRAQEHWRCIQLLLRHKFATYGEYISICQINI